MICHEWKLTPEVRTTPVKCLLCEDEAVVVVYAPHVTIQNKATVSEASECLAEVRME
jgi:hypothetical protein